MIRITTTLLCAMIGDLLLTAANAETDEARAGILLHTDRGYPDPAEPGVSDILVGTSCTRFMIGHTYVGCWGQMPPMVWPVSSATSVVAVFKPLAKQNKEHAVTISTDGAHALVQEDPDLFNEGQALTVKLGDLDTYPRSLWETLDQDTVAAASQRGVDPREGRPKPRVDFHPAVLKPFVDIAKRRNEILELYRLTQDAPLMVSIGDRYRGAIAPQPYERKGKDAGVAAWRPTDAEVYTPVLPPVPQPVATPEPDTTPGEPELPFPGEGEALVAEATAALAEYDAEQDGEIPPGLELPTPTSEPVS